MAGESVNENIYLATTFGYGGQKRFQNPPLCIAERCMQLIASVFFKFRFCNSDRYKEFVLRSEGRRNQNDFDIKSFR